MSELTSNLTKLGNTNTEYKSQYDKSLLEPIERELRRKDYIAPMNGVDVWTCFEVSFLLESGLPFFCVLRIYNPADSKNIFESKSIKLYLNSYNNTKFKDAFSAITQIKTDLQEFVESDELDVALCGSFNNEYNSPSIKLEGCYPNTTINDYNYNPDLLKTSIKEMELTDKTLTFHSDLLRSNCEITNQPDWGRVIVEYIPNEKVINTESLLQYIVSFRNHQEFHEPTCERIYNDLYKLLDAKELTVICQYTRRGGIDINPIRSTNKERALKLAKNLPKLLQQ